MSRGIRRFNQIRIAVAAFTIGATPVLSGCWDSEIAKRFREGYQPGFVEGLSQAIADPANSQDGFRRLGQALFEGLGSVMTPRSGSSASDN